MILLSGIKQWSSYFGTKVTPVWSIRDFLTNAAHLNVYFILRYNYTHKIEYTVHVCLNIVSSRIFWNVSWTLGCPSTYKQRFNNISMVLPSFKEQYRQQANKKNILQLIGELHWVVGRSVLGETSKMYLQQYHLCFQKNA